MVLSSSRRVTGWFMRLRIARAAGCRLQAAATADPATASLQPAACPPSRPPRRRPLRLTPEHKRYSVIRGESTMLFGLLPGSLDVLVLKALAARPNHGYGVARWMRETTDDALVIEEGALYTALHRLEKAG